MDNLQLNALCEYEEKLNGKLLVTENNEGEENEKQLKYNDYINKINNQLNCFVIEFTLKTS